MPNDLLTIWKHFWKSNKVYLLSYLVEKIIINSKYSPQSWPFVSDNIPFLSHQDCLCHFSVIEWEVKKNGLVLEVQLVKTSVQTSVAWMHFWLLRSSVRLPGYLMNSRSKAGPCPWPLADREIRPAGILCIFQVLFQCYTEPHSLSSTVTQTSGSDDNFNSCLKSKCTLRFAAHQNRGRESIDTI